MLFFFFKAFYSSNRKLGCLKNCLQPLDVIVKWEDGAGDDENAS